MQDFVEKLKGDMHNSIDFCSKVLEKQGDKVFFVYLKSITDNLVFSQAIYEPILEYNKELDFETLKQLVKSNDVTEVDQDEVHEKILKGSVVVFLSNSERFLAVDILKFNTRTPSEPPTSSVIMGPREGFTEDIKTNISLIRKRFYGKDLVLENLFLGEETNTQVVLAYLNDVVDKKILKELKKRLKKIKIDGVVDAYYLIPLISDRPNSFVKQIGVAEKPDIVGAKILEGRVAIIVDNSPIVLTVPFVFLEDLQSSNDYYTNYFYSSILRLVRLVGLFFAVVGPGIYISLQLFHYNVLPIKYLITVANSTQQVPFTPFIEILFITLLFQILYEVSLRLPSYLGLATSIVGALILGDTGVKAGLISPPAVIVVAIAKIALYTVPDQYSQITVLQFVFIFLGASLGLLGVIGGMIYVLAYVNSIENFGAPYLAPFSPFIFSDNKDGLLKVPITDMKNRPKAFKNNDEERINVQEE
ncbi:MAG: spore germination protein [Clostridiales bacterium]|nr:spore germination protein [Clostridiales bacterium]